MTNETCDWCGHPKHPPVYCSVMVDTTRCFCVRGAGVVDADDHAALRRRVAELSSALTMERATAVVRESTGTARAEKAEAERDEARDELEPLDRVCHALERVSGIVSEQRVLLAAARVVLTDLASTRQLTRDELDLYWRIDAQVKGAP